MDNIDFEILKIMQNNARISIKELSQTINLSQPAVSARVKHLEETGSIESYKTVINPAVIKKNLFCMCLLTAKSQNLGEPFFDYVRKHPDIDECYCIAGVYEFLIRISTESSDSLGVILDEMRVLFELKTSTYTIVKTIKGHPNAYL